jgi:hypothetical protein
MTLLILAVIAAGTRPLRASDHSTTFERVFGVSRQLDPKRVEQVRSLPAGERLLVDSDGDGRHEEAWFIDTSPRHSESRRPILVRVIDEDGDLDVTGPDLDNDLYLADWHADGDVDGVVDYEDQDGDGDLDAMGIYFDEYQQPWRDDNHVKVWFAIDVGDDNRLWYDVDYAYDQNLCQYRSHFSGDEVFYQLELTAGSTEWLNIFEDPFAFYDLDDDLCSEVAVRITAVGDVVKNLRYSMDIDNDSHGRRTHDYDFSITALPGSAEVRTDETVTERLTVRGIPVHPMLRWDAARAFAQNASWGRLHLTWDEMNANTDGNVVHDPHERWEGVINHAWEDFPQMGAPPSSLLNKRNELCRRHEPPLRLYRDSTDRRMHLVGAEIGQLDVDYDLDGKADARYTYRDRNSDGYFDERTVDVDGDGTPEFTWPMTGGDVREYELGDPALRDIYLDDLSTSLRESQVFIDIAVSALGGWPGEAEKVQRFFLEELSKWMPAAGLGERMRSTPAGARLYVGLARDRLLAEMKTRWGATTEWPELEAAYARGNYAVSAEMTRQHFVRDATAVNPAAFGQFAARIPIRVSNVDQPRRENWPITIPLTELRASAEDFNADCCAMVVSDRWLDYRQLPHQIDEADPQMGTVLSFVADIPADAVTTCYIYYSPSGTKEYQFPLRTGVAQDWVPPNIGWESSRCAYRAYWGQFDFFGKGSDELIYASIGNQSYHSEVSWGIDALHVGETAGLGGLTLYQDGVAHPVRNPAGKGDLVFSKRPLVHGPVRAAIEMTAGHILPDAPEATVRFVCMIYAGRQETEITAAVAGLDPPVVLAPGLVKLPRETFFIDRKQGCMGSWGFQEDVIGEIGLALITRPSRIQDVTSLPAEHRLICETNAQGQLKYWVIGDWRRGRDYPVAPTASDWQRSVRLLAERLVDDVQVRVGPREQVDSRVSAR